MWNKIKQIYNRVLRIMIAVILILFMIFTILTFTIEGVAGNLDSLEFISLLAVIFSLPGTVNIIVEEFNPKKKVYKLSSRCPKCKYLVQMDMKEE